MDYAGLILDILDQGLKLFNTLEAKSLAEDVIKMKENFNAEYAKGDLRDDALLAMYDRQLLNAGRLFLTILEGQSSKDKP